MALLETSKEEGNDVSVEEEDIDQQLKFLFGGTILVDESLEVTSSSGQSNGSEAMRIITIAIVPWYYAS